MLGIYMGSPQDGGVFVHSVIPGTAADSMGLRQGDVITALNGQTVDSNIDLWRTVRSADIGDGVQVTIQRDGTEQSFEGSYGSWPDDIPNTDWDQRSRERELQREQRRTERQQQKDAAENGGVQEKGFLGRLNDAIKSQQALEEQLRGKPIETPLYEAALHAPLMHAAAAATLLGFQDWQFHFSMHVDAAAQSTLASGKTKPTQLEPGEQSAPAFELQLYYTPHSVDL